MTLSADREPCQCARRGPEKRQRPALRRCVCWRGASTAAPSLRNGSRSRGVSARRGRGAARRPRRLGYLSDARYAQALVSQRAGATAGAPSPASCTVKACRRADAAKDALRRSRRATSSPTPRRCGARRFGAPPADEREKGRQVRFLMAAAMALRLRWRWSAGRPWRVTSSGDAGCADATRQNAVTLRESCAARGRTLASSATVRIGNSSRLSVTAQRTRCHAEPRRFHRLAREPLDRINRVVRVGHQSRIDAVAQIIRVAAVATCNDR